MKKLLCMAVIAAISTVFCSFNTPTASDEHASQLVIICTGPDAKRYHADEDCRGLNKCTHTIRTVTLAEAEEMGRTPCKICCR